MNRVASEQDLQNLCGYIPAKEWVGTNETGFKQEDSPVLLDGNNHPLLDGMREIMTRYNYQNRNMADEMIELFRAHEKSWFNRLPSAAQGDAVGYVYWQDGKYQVDYGIRFVKAHAEHDFKKCFCREDGTTIRDAKIVTLYSGPQLQPDEAKRIADLEADKKRLIDQLKETTKMFSRALRELESEGVPSRIWDLQCAESNVSIISELEKTK